MYLTQQHYMAAWFQYSMLNLVSVQCTTVWISYSCQTLTFGDLWRRGVVVSVVGLINEVNRHRARLVLGWVTVCGRVNHLGM